jgi:hypothetical protein
MLERFVKSLDDEGLDWYYVGLFGGEGELEPICDERDVYEKEYVLRGLYPPME